MLEFTLVEGRNRQIRKMCEALGHRVIDLHRTKFSSIGLRGLAENQWAELTEREMEQVLKAYNSNS
jgi:pseudouridine synthase